MTQHQELITIVNEFMNKKNLWSEFNDFIEKKGKQAHQLGFIED